MQEKILVLGSDYSTEQVVIEAKELGLYTIVTDLMNASPAKKQADEAWQISTTDIDQLEQKCIENNISAIMFGASDFNINNARVLCKRLNLPIYCHDDYAWEVARNKGLFKDICKSVNAPVAEDYPITAGVSEADIKAIKFPVVVKPVDKSGNRGLSFCNNSEELKQACKLARSISENSRIIVERRLFGEEYNVHYVLANGEAKILYFNATYHQPGQRSNLYSFKCTTTNHLKQYLEEVDASAKAVLKAVGCKEGIAWFDMIRDSDGSFYFLEMGYRFGGVMTYRPYQRVSGFNAIRWMLDCALGKEHKEEQLPDIQLEKQISCAASYHLFSLEDGIIYSIEGLNEISCLPNVWIDMPKREGEKVRKFACCGLIGIYGKDIKDLCETLQFINQTFSIRNENQQVMTVLFDDYKTIYEANSKGLQEMKAYTSTSFRGGV